MSEQQKGKKPSKHWSGNLELYMYILWSYNLKESLVNFIISKVILGNFLKSNYIINSAMLSQLFWLEFCLVYKQFFYIIV